MQEHRIVDLKPAALSESQEIVYSISLAFHLESYFESGVFPHHKLDVNGVEYQELLELGLTVGRSRVALYHFVH